MITNNISEIVSMPTYKELSEPDSIEQLIEAKSRDSETQKFFGMSGDKITAILKTIQFSSEGFDLSPSFQSPGYGDAIDKPLVKLPDVIPAGTDQFDHEFNHGLHYGLCKDLFEGDDWRAGLELVRTAILGDDGFIELTKQYGSVGQQMLISSVQTLIGSPGLSREATKAFSWQLGALVYQHAWYVDPGMIEAVGSFKNKGVFLKATLTLNHWFGAIILPGHDVMEGYMDTNCQEMFAKASEFQKALLIKKADYDREKYFSR